MSLLRIATLDDRLVSSANLGGAVRASSTYVSRMSFQISLKCANSSQFTLFKWKLNEWLNKKLSGIADCEKPYKSIKSLKLKAI